MNKIRLICLSVMTALSAMTVWAGGLLTNTNQSIEFLRNPTRDAAIGIDGVYSNPAGVVFLGDGIHVSFNLQNAHQTRTVLTTSPYFPMGIQNGGKDQKEFEGVADAPIIPSLQAAWNKGKWSFQFNFAITGGGGKCEFDRGLGSFENVVGSIAYKLNGLGVSAYDVNGYMKGRQYYYGFTLGAAYKVSDNFSVYGGLRLLYGSASYQAKLSDIQVKTADGMVAFDKFVDASTATVIGGLAQVNAGIEQLKAAGIPETNAMYQELLAKQQTLMGAEQQLNMLEPYKNGVNLMSDQAGWGVAPIIGVDYKTGKFNFAAKYEFKTRMRMKNKSTVKEASIIPAINKFVDGSSVAEDSPALLTVGAQYEILSSLRVMAGWHHYFDQDTKQWTKEMLDDSNEYLLGAEWDINKVVSVSAGGQRTKYGMKNAGMNDMSFNVSSYSFGFGVGVNVTEKVKINAAYFQTLYDDYNKVTSESPRVSDSFTRTNRVLGLGVNFTL